MPEPTTYLSVSEVRAYLAKHKILVSDETIRRWAKRGKIPSKRLMRTYWFAVEDVEALLVEVAA